MGQGRKKPAYLRVDHLRRQYLQRNRPRGRLEYLLRDLFPWNTPSSSNESNVNDGTFKLQLRDGTYREMPLLKNMRLRELQVMIELETGIRHKSQSLCNSDGLLLQDLDATLDCLGIREGSILHLREGDKINDIALATTVLDLPANATEEEINARYKDLARIWHPDNCRVQDTAAINARSAQFRAVKDAKDFMIDLLSEPEWPLDIKMGQSVLTILVSSSDLISEVKKKVCESAGVPHSKRFLYFNCMVLNEQKNLSQCGITSDDSICLLQDVSMQVFATLPDGKTITLDVNQTDTIACVKEQISKKAPTPSEQMRVTFAGKELFDWQTLVGYCIKRESTLVLHDAGLKGGSGGLSPDEIKLNFGSNKNYGQYLRRFYNERNQGTGMAYDALPEREKKVWREQFAAHTRQQNQRASARARTIFSKKKPTSVAPTKAPAAPTRGRTSSTVTAPRLTASAPPPTPDDEKKMSATTSMSTSTVTDSYARATRVSLSPLVAAAPPAPSAAALSNGTAPPTPNDEKKMSATTSMSTSTVTDSYARATRVSLPLQRSPFVPPAPSAAALSNGTAPPTPDGEKKMAATTSMSTLLGEGEGHDDVGNAENIHPNAIVTVSHNKRARTDGNDLGLGMMPMEFSSAQDSPMLQEVVQTNISDDWLPQFFRRHPACAELQSHVTNVYPNEQVVSYDSHIKLELPDMTNMNLKSMMNVIKNSLAGRYVVIAQHFPSNSDCLIIDDRLLYLGEDGLPGQRSWHGPHRLLRDVLVYNYGKSELEAVSIVVGGTAAINKSPFTQKATWHSSRETAADCERSAIVTDPIVKELVQDTMELFGSNTKYIVLGGPMFKACVEGDALSSGWINSDQVVNTSTLPHGYQIQCRLFNGNVRDNALEVFNEAAAFLLGCTVIPITDPDLKNKILPFTIGKVKAVQVARRVRTVVDSTGAVRTLDGDIEIFGDTNLSLANELSEYINNNYFTGYQFRGLQDQLDTIERYGLQDTLAMYECDSCDERCFTYYQKQHYTCTKNGHFNLLVDGQEDSGPLDHFVRGYCREDGCHAAGRLMTCHQCAKSNRDAKMYNSLIPGPWFDITHRTNLTIVVRKTSNGILVRNAIVGYKEVVSDMLVEFEPIWDEHLRYRDDPHTRHRWEEFVNNQENHMFFAGKWQSKTPPEPQDMKTAGALETWFKRTNIFNAENGGLHDGELECCGYTYTAIPYLEPEVIESDSDLE